jgi:O-antigen ligase
MNGSFFRKFQLGRSLSSLSLPVLCIGAVIIPISYCTVLPDQYIFPKWFSVYIVTLCGIAAVLISRTYYFPAMERKFAGLAVGLAACFIFSILINWPGAYEKHILDWLCFFMLVTISTSTFHGKQERINRFIAFYLFAAALICIHGFLQLLGIEVIPNLARNDFPSSFFGFQNMTAEFIGLAVILQVYSLFLSLKRRVNNFLLIFQFLFLSAQLLFLGKLLCRGVSVATLVASIMMLFLPWQKFWERLIPLVVIGYMSLVLAGTAFSGNKSGEMFVPKPLRLDDQSVVLKEGNTRLRLIRWKNTLSLIWRNKFGIGPGNFEFGYVPYHASFAKDYESTEGSVVRSPHNGYLELAAENGILSLLLMLGLMCYMFWRLVYGYICNPNQRTVVPLLAAVFVYWAIDAFFAFPLEIALPFYVIAVFLGYGLTVMSSQTCRRVHVYGWKLGYALSAIAIAGLAGAALTSTFFESHYPRDYWKISFACEIFPSNWRACARRAEAELEMNKNSWAENTTFAMLARQENNYVALQLLSIAFLKQGRFPEACEALKKYDVLFDNASSLHQNYLTNCQNLR